jgi:hypothetical protein
MAEAGRSQSNSPIQDYWIRLLFSTGYARLKRAEIIREIMTILATFSGAGFHFRLSSSFEALRKTKQSASRFLPCARRRGSTFAVRSSARLGGGVSLLDVFANEFQIVARGVEGVLRGVCEWNWTFEDLERVAGPRQLF